jgi:hypothetical protein
MENTSVSQQWIYANHIENTASFIVDLQRRCIETELSDYCLRIRCRGNAFTELLPSNGRIA